MALMRYVGPYPEVRVVVAGTELGIVENGGSVAVPDDLAEQVAWPDDLWENAADGEREKEIMADYERALEEAGSQPADAGLNTPQPGEEAN